MFEGVLWNPLFFLWLLVLLVILVYLFGKSWNLSFNKGIQREPFISGNVEEEGVHPTISDIYWGFVKVLEDYYENMKSMHSNVINDYIYWFILVLALVMLVVEVS